MQSCQSLLFYAGGLHTSEAKKSHCVSDPGQRAFGLLLLFVSYLFGLQFGLRERCKAGCIKEKNRYSLGSVGFLRKAVCP